LTRQANAERARSELQERLRKVLQSSRRLHCACVNSAGVRCTFACTLAWQLRQHLRLGRHTYVDVSVPRDTDQDYVWRRAKQVIDEVTMGATLEGLLEREESTVEETQLQPASYLAKSSLYYGDPVNPSRMDPQPRFARRYETQESITLNSAQLRFLLHAQGLGDASVDGGAKAFPGMCEQAMYWKGTPLGATTLPVSRTDPTFMAANATNTREFTIWDVLTVNQIKCYLGKPRAQLVRQLQSCLEQEEKARKKATDPLFAALESMSRSKIECRFKRLKANHAAEYQLNAARKQQFDTLEDQTIKPEGIQKTELKELRALTMEMVISLGSLPADVTIYTGIA
jgi:hypothetical protein